MTFLPNVQVRTDLPLAILMVESILSLLEIMQLISLFSLVNTDYTPKVLTDYYESLGVCTLEFIPNIFKYVLPNSVNPAYDSENDLSDNTKYHPNIFSYSFPVCSPQLFPYTKHASWERTS